MYLIFATEQEAMQYSHGIAIQHGHGKAGNTIQHWYSWRETADRKWAVQCPEGTEPEPEWKAIEEIET